MGRDLSQTGEGDLEQAGLGCMVGSLCVGSKASLSYVQVSRRDWGKARWECLGG